MPARSSFRSILLVSLALVGVLAGCAGSSGDASPPPSSTKYVVNPLQPGHVYLQLGKNQYPFDGVICATGPVPSDPDDTVRDFGVYANFELDGSLVAVSMTRYENHSQGAIPTITDTALVQMQGKGEVKGLKAQRARIIGQSGWRDINDPTATGPLIVRSGDRYDAKGRFGAPDASGVPDDDSATTTTTTPGSPETIMGELTARCPAKSNTPTTTGGAGPSTLSPSSETPPATTPPGSDDGRAPGTPPAR